MLAIRVKSSKTYYTLLLVIFLYIFKALHAHNNYDVFCIHNCVKLVFISFLMSKAIKNLYIETHVHEPSFKIRHVFMRCTEVNHLHISPI